MTDFPSFIIKTYYHEEYLIAAAEEIEISMSFY